MWKCKYCNFKVLYSEGTAHVINLGRCPNPKCLKENALERYDLYDYEEEEDDESTI